MKSLMTRVLLATDFSPCAARALEYALAVTSSWKAELHVLHVLEFYPGMDPEYPVNQMYLDELRKDADRQFIDVEKHAAGSGVSIRKRIEFGIPSQRIETVATEQQADLIILGTHGRTGLQHVLVGSTAERVVRTGPCPVLSVKTGRIPASGPATDAADRPVTIRRILVPIDFSECSLDALEYATQFAKHMGASVTILHTLEPVPYNLDFTLHHSQDWREKKDYLQGRLEVLCAMLTSNRIRADQVLKAGLPTESIVGYAREQGHDLVIMGTHGRRGISHMLTGSVAEAMLRLAPCPVLTVRKPAFGPDHERIVPAGEAYLATM